MSIISTQHSYYDIYAQNVTIYCCDQLSNSSGLKPGRGLPHGHGNTQLRTNELAIEVR